MYEKAEEEAFQQMDADECTEDQCIAIIQELLQVEEFFNLEISALISEICCSIF